MVGLAIAPIMDLRIGSMRSDMVKFSKDRTQVQTSWCVFITAIPSKWVNNIGR